MPWKRILLAFLLMLPGLGLIVGSIPGLQDGLLWDATIPVPEDIEDQWPLSKDEYLRTASLLQKVEISDVRAHAVAAEAAILAGTAPFKEIRPLEDALSRAPANARAWMILSDAYKPTSPKRAAAALSQSFLLAPYDYFLAGPRAERAAALWTYLDSDTRAAALRQAVMLWDAPELRDEIHSLLRSQPGVDLLNRAFAGHPNDLRALEQWLKRTAKHD
jgi:hypothetical protein